MNDYYKILGLKETATAEEIRGRWLELIQKYHPDQSQEQEVEDERVKEINEAYQVLKFSSTRVEYDLERSYLRKRRRVYFSRISLSLTILVILYISGAVYFKKTDFPPLLKQKNLSIQKFNDIKKPMGEEKIFSPMEKTVPKTIPPSPPPIKITQEDHQKKPMSQKDKKDSTNQINPITQRTQRTQINLVDRKNQVGQVKQEQEVPTVMGRELTVKIDRIPKRDEVGPIKELNSAKPADVVNRAAKWVQQGHQRNVATVMNPLIAQEEEVRQFFVKYIERYTQKDVESFLSCFSSKAIENQKLDYERIRGIYAIFFNQSEGLQYRLEDTRIEIYQNAVQVKARYEIDQIFKKGGVKKVWKGNIRWVLIQEDSLLKILTIDYQHEKSS